MSGGSRYTERTVKSLEFQRNFAICIDAVMEMIAPFWNLIERTSALVGIGVHWRWAIYIAAATLLVEDTFVLLQCLFDRFGSVFPQCGLMVFPGVVIVSR